VPHDHPQTGPDADPRPPRVGDAAHPPPARGGATAAVGVDLTGDLPCIGCGYNLRGLSIRSVCSECGTPVRATILARVDPMAEQLQPLKRPWLTAGGLVLWAWAGLLAALLVWLDRLTDVANEMFGVRVGLPLAWQIELVAIACSMLGAAVLVRPVAVVSTWECVKAAGGVLAYLPLLALHFTIHAVYDPRTGPPLVGSHLINAGADLLDADRSLYRLAVGALIVVIVLGLRANAVSLAERSLVMRLGRVDTQPLSALAWAMAVTMAGDLLVIAFAGGDGLLDWIVELAALLMIAVGSFLFTLGLVGVGIDTVRLRPVLLQPAPGLTDIFRDD
jgi:hypothetical protein